MDPQDKRILDTVAKHWPLEAPPSTDTKAKLGSYAWMVQLPYPTDAKICKAILDSLEQMGDAVPAVGDYMEHLYGVVQEHEGSASDGPSSVQGVSLKKENEYLKWKGLSWKEDPACGTGKWFLYGGLELPDPDTYACRVHQNQKACNKCRFVSTLRGRCAR